MDNRELAKLAAQLQLELLQVTSPAGDAKFRFGGKGEILYDLNGEYLAERYGLFRSGLAVGYVDVALHPVLGLQLNLVSIGPVWQPNLLRERARVVASKFDPDAVLGPGRFILYCFPRLGIGFDGSGGTTIIVGAATMEVVREAAVEKPKAFGEPSPWSVLDVAWREGAREGESYSRWSAIARELSVYVRPEHKAKWLYGLPAKLVLRHFSSTQVCEKGTAKICIDEKDEICFRGKGQANGEWCVPACVDMLLDFFLPNSDREKSAAIELGQIDQKGNPIKLPEEQAVNIPIAIKSLAAREKVVLNGGLVSGVDLLDNVEENFALKMPGPMILLGHSHAWGIFGFEECMTGGGGGDFWFKAFDPLPKPNGEAKDLMSFSASLHIAVIFAFES